MKSEEMVLFNARVHTMNAQTPRGTGLRIRNGRIVEVINSQASSMESYGSQYIDLQGRTVLPGLCDAHIHIEKYARSLDQIDCETNTEEECLTLVAQRCRKLGPGEWVVGHGWNQNTWGGYGSLERLDAISPDNPVYLTAKSLHAGWANSNALGLCNLSENSKDPPKGKLQRDDRGNLTGILFEDAMLLVSTIIPKPNHLELVSMIKRAQNDLHGWGITAIHDFDGLGCLDALLALEADDVLRLRVLKHIREKELDEALARDLRSRLQGEWIRIGHLKLFADGALGPRTAAMLQYYEGEPDNTGLLQFSVEELVEVGQAAAKIEYPLAIHAIGDKANRTVLDAFEKLQKLTQNISMAPHRIEHVQLIHPQDISRLASLGITASMQPVHAISDRLMADKYWGERVRWSYAWNSQISSGARLIFGSDAPVESPDPWAGIAAAVNRKSAHGKGDSNPWVAEERIPLESALQAYTRSPAQASSWHSLIGQLCPDFAADLIILESDPFGIKADDLWDIRPSAVMVNGEWVVRNF